MQEILNEINERAKRIKKEIRLMEVCGTHTEAITKNGIRNILPKNIKLISGPGCPVCVTDQRDIDNIVELALNNIPVATYGDMLKVPGNKMSLEDARSHGAKIFTVYSAEDVFKIEEKNLVFFGIGFDTTAPMTASIVKKNIVVYSSHKHFVPAMKALLEDKNIRIDGFINPGHVSTIIGVKPYSRLSSPQVIAGFEPEDILISICMLLRQIEENEKKVENEYTRSVFDQGNKKAMSLINDVFELREARWRGFGTINNSGFEIKKKYEKLDAKVKYRNILKEFNPPQNPELKFCQCSKIVKGIIEPKQCVLFGKKCTPEYPMGPCMVSREGACNIQYRYKI